MRMDAASPVPVLPLVLVVVDVGRAAGHAEVGVGSFEVAAEARTVETSGHLVDGLQLGTHAPEHEVGVAAGAHQGIGVQGDPVGVLGGHGGELILAGLALGGGQATPLGLHLVERVLDEITAGVGHGKSPLPEQHER